MLQMFRRGSQRTEENTGDQECAAWGTTDGQVKKNLKKKRWGEKSALLKETDDVGGGRKHCPTWIGTYMRDIGHIRVQSTTDGTQLKGSHGGKVQRDTLGAQKLF